MKKLETIENEVKKILDKDIRARKDDMYLYYKYLFSVDKSWTLSTSVHHGYSTILIYK